MSSIQINGDNSEESPLNATTASHDSAATLYFTVRAGSALGATFLLILCGRRLLRGDYPAAFLTFVGAMIAGMSPYLASLFLLG